MAFLKSTRVGCISASRRPPEEVAEAESVAREGSGDEGHEGGPGPPRV